MAPQPFLYVANWKMAMPLLQHAKLFVHELARESAQFRAQTIICPSTIHLAPLITHFKEYAIQFGAQNCSEHASGAYTGETAAQSLKELDIQYCLVGHSERRTYFNENNQSAAQKVKQLLAHHINPIICIGETLNEFENKKTFESLQAQLELIIKTFNDESHSLSQLYIAYEPVWAIGTGKSADAAYIQEVFSWINHYCLNAIKHSIEPILLYGGSVDPISVQSLKNIEHLKGFLIGGASLDFQKFKKIVL